MTSGSCVIGTGVLAVFLVAGLGGTANAGTVDIFSQPGTGSNNIAGTNVGIPVSPAWATPPAGSEWISYGQTGCNDFDPLTGHCIAGPQNPPGTTVNGTPTATFYQTFTITDAMDYGILNVWADDTAGVWLDSGTVTSGNGSGGTLLYAPNGNLIGNCAGPQPIGCLDDTGAAIPLNLSTGTYTLVIDAYQLVGDSPFGVMYNGILTDTPEPASYLLMGLGLAGLGALLRRRKQA